jgi:hypothetical protein
VLHSTEEVFQKSRNSKIRSQAVQFQEFSERVFQGQQYAQVKTAINAHGLSQTNVSVSDCLECQVQLLKKRKLTE